jgi:hypothetical protein
MRRSTLCRAVRMANAAQMLPTGLDGAPIFLRLAERRIVRDDQYRAGDEPREIEGREALPSRNMQRHRHQEFIHFLNLIEARVPVGKAIHVILDNYAAHKHAKIREWHTEVARQNCAVR